MKTSKFISRFLLVAVLFGMPSLSFAQRTMSGQGFLDAGVSTSFTSFGGYAGYGAYTRSGLWRASASAVNRKADLVSADGVSSPMDYMRLTAGGDYLFRLAGSSNRLFGMYGGAGVFLGYEAVDPFGKCRGVSLPVSGAFIYGADVSLELECFVSERTALVVFGRVPYAFGSQIEGFGCEAGIAFRFDLLAR